MYEVLYKLDYWNNISNRNQDNALNIDVFINIPFLQIITSSSSEIGIKTTNH